MPLTTCQRQRALGVLIYLKPFRQLFSAVGYGTIGSQERGECAFRDLEAGPGGSASTWSDELRGWIGTSPAR